MAHNITIKEIIAGFCIAVGIGGFALMGYARKSTIPDHKPRAQTITLQNIGTVVLKDWDGDFSVDSVKNKNTGEYLFLNKALLPQYGTQNTKILEQPHQHSFDEIYKNMNILERRNISK